jgi:protein-L-isoaspartate(D-aspartate) O-methyltransferase
MRRAGLFFLIILAWWALVACVGAENEQPSKDRWMKEREKMVKLQIAHRGVRDPLVLAAMREVERHLFVPESYRNQAYADYPLPIGEGQTISQPYIVALMTEALALKRSDRVLEVGTGSGYQAAILGELCEKVFTVEIIKSLGERSKTLLAELGYENIEVKVGDGYQGWPEHAPFDAIIVTCSPTHVPQPLKEQLAEGGRMVIPVGEQGVQDLVILKKQDNRLHIDMILPVRFVPMVDEKGAAY